MSETITLDILYANTLLGVSNFTKNNVLLSFEVEIIHSLVPQSLKQSVFFLQTYLCLFSYLYGLQPYGFTLKSACKMTAKLFDNIGA